MQFTGRHVISISDFSRTDLVRVLELARSMETTGPAARLDGKLMATLFFEPSTRTRLSFEAAMHKLGGKVNLNANSITAFHPPCTLQHGQQLKGGVEQHLNALGFNIQTALNEPHLCCGSAGTYSVLNPELAYQLRDRKLDHLSALQPKVIVSANIGCITHLQSGTETPVRHWVELLDEAVKN